MTSLYLAFWATPTISMSSSGRPPRAAILLPTASRPRPNFFANCSLTMATLAAPAPSARVNSRPDRSRMPSVRRKSGATALKLETMSVSGPASKPSTETPWPQLSPARTGTTDPVTLDTPGIAASSSSSRSNNWRDRSDV